MSDKSPKCPFCNSSNACEHLLLLVDKTFRSAEGGLLMNAFTHHWNALFDEDEDMDEREVFDSLLEEVADVADAESNYDYEGGPGMSSDYAYYYIKSGEGAKELIERFSE
jgi:hypothetical protein